MIVLIMVGFAFFISILMYGIGCAMDGLPFFPRLHYYRWARKYDPGCVKLNFRQFKRFYSLAPDKYVIPIKTFKNCRQWTRDYEMPRYDYLNTFFFKTYFDYRRAMRWLIKYKKVVNKNNYQLQEYKNTVAFMKMVQKDIDRAQGEASHAIDNTEKQIEKILEDLKVLEVQR